MFPISHYGPEMKVMMSAISFGFEIIHSGAKENLSAISPLRPCIPGSEASGSVSHLVTDVSAMSGAETELQWMTCWTR